jgi:choline kinase
VPLTAIVLAAGRGSRLGALTASRPKCLLPLGSETLLDRQLRLLEYAGIDSTVVVTGYRAGDIAAHVVNRAAVTLRDNPQHEGTRPLSSLLAACEFFNGDTIILNCDVVFGREALPALLSAEAEFSVLVSRARAAVAHVPARLAGERVVDIGKHVPVAEGDAEFCCIARVRASSAAVFADTVRECAAQSLQTGWSMPFLKLAQSGAYVAAVDYDGPLIDVNSPADYLSALKFAEDSLHENN